MQYKINSINEVMIHNFKILWNLNVRSLLKAQLINMAKKPVIIALAVLCALATFGIILTAVSKPWELIVPALQLVLWVGIAAVVVVVVPFYTSYRLVTMIFEQNKIYKEDAPYYISDDPDMKALATTKISIRDKWNDLQRRNIKPPSNIQPEA